MALPWNIIPLRWASLLIKWEKHSLGSFAKWVRLETTTLSVLFSLIIKTLKGSREKDLKWGFEIRVTAFQWSNFERSYRITKFSTTHYVRKLPNLYLPEFQTCKYSADCLQTSWWNETRLHTVQDRIFPRFHEVIKIPRLQGKQF